MVDPDVSVIIPVYNTGQYLRECLNSVLAQPGVSIEAICVNDGSTDSSKAILDEYRVQDSRVRVIDQENGGLSCARNAGLEQARGRYVCFLDSDDYWDADGLADLVDRADEADLDALLFNARSIREPGIDDEDWARYATYYERSAEYSAVVTGAELATAMRKQRDYRPSACLYLARRSLLIDSELRFIPGIIHEDTAFTFHLLLAARRAAHSSTTLYVRRVRPGSIMTSTALVASFRGYLLSYVKMSQLLAGRVDGDEVGPQLAGLAHRTLVYARAAYLKLSSEEAEAVLAEFAAEPSAMLAALIVGRERSDRQRLTGRIATLRAELKTARREVKALKRELQQAGKPLSFLGRVRRKLGATVRLLTARKPLVLLRDPSRR